MFGLISNLFQPGIKVITLHDISVGSNKYCVCSSSDFKDMSMSGTCVHSLPLLAIARISVSKQSLKYFFPRRNFARIGGDRKQEALLDITSPRPLPECELHINRWSRKKALNSVSPRIVVLLEIISPPLDLNHAKCNIDWEDINPNFSAAEVASMKCSLRSWSICLNSAPYFSFSDSDADNRRSVSLSPAPPSTSTPNCRFSCSMRLYGSHNCAVCLQFYFRILTNEKPKEGYKGGGGVIVLPLFEFDWLGEDRWLSPQLPHTHRSSDRVPTRRIYPVSVIVVEQIRQQSLF